MHATEHPPSVPAGLDVPSLMTWDEVLQQETEDRIGFARRATLALLTLDGDALSDGFRGDRRRGIDEALRTVAIFQAHLQQMQQLAAVAERRLQRLAVALAAAE